LLLAIAATEYPSFKARRKILLCPQEGSAVALAPAIIVGYRQFTRLIVSSKLRR
jgi:hypothetical protein